MQPKETVPTTRRERNKADKLQRIRDAALALFLTKGYDAATTREIAKVAGVALGTLFVYAENKRDLLFLIVNDDLEAVIDEAELLVNSRRGFVANAVAVAELHFSRFARKPDISRLALREMYFYDTGTQSMRFHQTRVDLRGIFTKIATYSTETGETSCDDVGTVGDILFALYQVQVRTFLNDKELDINKARKNFKAQCEQLINGLRPRP